jgi:hypothetical protein
MSKKPSQMARIGKRLASFLVEGHDEDAFQTSERLC